MIDYEFSKKLSSDCGSGTTRPAGPSPRIRSNRIFFRRLSEFIFSPFRWRSVVPFNCSCYWILNNNAVGYFRKLFREPFQIDTNHQRPQRQLESWINFVSSSIFSSGSQTLYECERGQGVQGGRANSTHFADHESRIQSRKIIMPIVSLPPGNKYSLSYPYPPSGTINLYFLSSEKVDVFLIADGPGFTDIRSQSDARRMGAISFTDVMEIKNSPIAIPLQWQSGWRLVIGNPSLNHAAVHFEIYNVPIPSGLSGLQQSLLEQALKRKYTS